MTYIPKKLQRAARKFQLTPRELQLLDLLACGKSWKCAALRMEISVSTVRFHSANLLRKIRAQNIASALAKIFCADTYGKP